MNEGSLWRWLSSRLPPGDYTRIESQCSPGLPDVSYALDVASNRFHTGTSIEFAHGWIELKIGGPGKYPFDPDIHKRKGLRPAQRLWLKRRIELGVPCLIAAAIASDLAVWRLPADRVDEFNTAHIDELRELADFWHPRRSIERLPVRLLI